MASERTKIKQVIAAQQVLGVGEPIRSLALGFAGPNPFWTRVVVVGADVALLVVSAVLTGTVLGLGLIPLLLVLIIVNPMRALAITEGDVRMWMKEGELRKLAPQATWS
jgi:hypothetical protein